MHPRAGDQDAAQVPVTMGQHTRQVNLKRLDPREGQAVGPRVAAHPKDDELREMGAPEDLVVQVSGAHRELVNLLLRTARGEGQGQAKAGARAVSDAGAGQGAGRMRGRNARTLRFIYGQYLSLAQSIDSHGCSKPPPPTPCLSYAKVRT